MARLGISIAAEFAGVASLARTVRRWGADGHLAVLTYHRVLDPTLEACLDDEVVDATPTEFEAQLRFLKDACNPIGLDDLLAYKSGGALPSNAVLITFDDGYRDNYRVALPLLERYGIPAVFFVTADCVERRALFWWDRIAWVVERAKTDRLELEYPRKRTILLSGDSGAKREAARKLARVVKSYWGLDLERYLEGIERAAGIGLSRSDERLIADANLMTWDEIRGLINAGMAVESHTMTHRVLGTLPEHAVDAELTGSRAMIERETGRPVRAVAFPVGATLETAPHVRRALRRAGYELGFSNATGMAKRWRFDPLEIPRIAMERGLAPSYFRAAVSIPGVAFAKRSALHA